MDFAEVTSLGWYKRANHLEHLNDLLLACSRREIKRLMVFMPPRYSKSETISHFFPCWWLGKNPDDNVILASYGQELAEDHGRKARDTLEEFGPAIYGLSVREDSSAVGRWQIAGHRGGYRAVGIGGAITGRGADLLIIDDAVKNSEEAWSATIQKRNAEWWDGTAFTRLEPDAVVIVMMTRWHQNDLAGYILNKTTEAWHVLELPALAGQADQINRLPGEALWPERFSQAAVEAQRDELCATDMGRYYWEAEYQQRPQLPEGLLYFDKRAIEYGLANCPEPRERFETRALPTSPVTGYVLVWERPITGERYYMGADTADGKGEALGSWSATGGPDRNSASIFRARDDVQVAQIYGRQEEHEYARVLNEWGKAYNNALLGVERNRRAVLVALRELNYPNLYYTEPPADMHTDLPLNPASRREYGWYTDTTSRPVMLGDLREGVSTGACKILDRDTYLEMQSFVMGDPPSAAPGQHDDRIFDKAIAWQVRKAVRRSSDMPMLMAAGEIRLG